MTDLSPHLRTQAEKRQAIVHLDALTKVLRQAEDELAQLRQASPAEYARLTDGNGDVVFGFRLGACALANDLHDEIHAIGAYLEHAAQRDLDRRFAEDMPDRAVIPFRRHSQAVPVTADGGDSAA
ncbi:hypothetical protein ABEG18_13185 [Alsobacter sp. KACC 23698]|uniref:Uncharacterized protein n=1 Tax=Alsobacter sp. KACC 23698 TaxID=3149229 RepID=A0AAU7J8U6_9HYPH